MQGSMAMSSYSTYDCLHVWKNLTTDVVYLSELCLS
jgi:hypothetical protein